METTEKSALLVLDLQNDLVSPSGKIGSFGLAAIVESRGLLESTAKVISGFRRRGEPIVYVRVGFRADYADALSRSPRVERLKGLGACVLGSWGTEFPDPIAPLPDELVFTKQCVNPFFNTGLLTALLHRQVTHVFLAGVQTNLVVESSARFCDDAGLAVSVLEDCCASMDPEAHRYGVEKSLPMFGRVVTSAALAQD